MAVRRRDAVWGMLASSAYRVEGAAPGRKAGAAPFLNIADRGVVFGPLPNEAARRANRRAFNAAIVEAGATKQMLVVPEGDIWIADGGVIIDVGGLVWRGSRRSRIIQDSDGAPVLHTGPALGSDDGVDMLDIDGAQLRYARPQTNQQGSNAFEQTGTSWSSFRNIVIGDVNATTTQRVSVPYNGLYFDPNSQCFSNSYRDIRIQHFFNYGMSMTSTTGGITQNRLDNIYISNGNSGGFGPGHQAPCAGGIETRNQAQDIWTGLNIEWMRCRAPVRIGWSRAILLAALNVEGVVVEGAAERDDAAFFVLEAAQLSLKATTFYNNRSVAAAAAYFSLKDGSRLTTEAVSFEDFGKPAGDGLYLFRAVAAPSDAASTVRLLDPPRFAGPHAIDGFDPPAARPTPPLLYVGGSPFNNTEVGDIGDSDTTMYAAASPGIVVGAPQTRRAVVLADRLSATDPCIIPHGVQRRIVCAEGVAGSLIVVDRTADGRVLRTLAAGQYVEATFADGQWIVTASGGP